MTERSLPLGGIRAPGLPRAHAPGPPGRGHDGVAGEAPAAVARPVTGAPRPMARAVARPIARAEQRRPIHVGVTVGIAAGLYAVSLAGVTALQSATNAALAADRAPAAGAVAAMRDGHERMDTSLSAAEAAYATAATAYADLATALQGHEGTLESLGRLVAKIEGTAAALPNRISLPTIRQTVVSRTTSRPATHATTGASGKP